MTLRARSAEAADAAAIARIYNEGIEDRVATFETRLRTAEEVSGWHLCAVALHDSEVLAFAKASPYSDRPCYAHIADFSVYTARAARRRGAGRVALEHLMHLARDAGIRKLTSRVFVENTASRALLKALGFREVGVHEKHAQLDGVWRDVVVVERLL